MDHRFPHEEISGSFPHDQQVYGPDFGQIDFMNEANFDQYIDLIRGENVFDSSSGDHMIYQDLFAGVDHFFSAPPPPQPAAGLFDFDVAMGNEHHLGFAVQQEEEEEEEVLVGEEEESSGSGGKKGGGKSDRSRTLISERKRRSRMKEKLYALRALVPNITKMDKASIVGDAVSYVQDMKMQAKKLKAEIASLESSLSSTSNGVSKYEDITNSTITPIAKKIFKMDVSEVEEKGFYVRIVSNKGQGVAMLLYRALESITTTFTIHNSNLAANSPHNYVFTFTLHSTMQQGENMDVNLDSMKLWMVTVFLNHGFEFQSSLAP